MENLVTIELIEEWFRKMIEARDPISPATWLDGAQKMNVLMQGLDEELIEADMGVNKEIAHMIEVDGQSAAGARLLVKGKDVYHRYLSLKAKKERVVEFIRIAKKRVELQQWDNQ